MDSLARAREVLERKFATGPLACDATNTMFWNVLTENEKQYLAEFFATAIDEARLEEARLGRGRCLTGMCNRERIAELEASLRDSQCRTLGEGESVLHKGIAARQ